MKQFIVNRHTTPNTPTLEQVPTEKIPVYDNLTDAEADLANLAAGQIIATTDQGASELLDTVDTVEAANMHPVTSNAVASKLALTYGATIAIGQAYTPPANANAIIVNIYTGDVYWNTTAIIHKSVLSHKGIYLRYGDKDLAAPIHIKSNGDIEIETPAKGSSTYPNATADIYIL